MEYLAVYGSLMTSQGMLVGLGVRSMVKLVGAAVIPGQLFDLGEYPGLIAGDEDAGVTGELFEILDLELLPILDEYEAFTPEVITASMFIRRRTALIEPRVYAWVYYFNGSVENCRPIVGLTWPEYKTRRW